MIISTSCPGSSRLHLLRTNFWLDLETIGRAIAETCPTEWPSDRKEALLEVYRSALQTAIAREEGSEIDGIGLRHCIDGDRNRTLLKGNRRNDESRSGLL